MNSCADVFSSTENREAFLNLAAEVFSVRRESLTCETAMGGLRQWDSINHLRLVMAVESRFKVHYPLERISELKTIKDFFSEK